MPREKLTGRVSYRLTDKEHREIQRLAGKESVDEWCRQAARERLKARLDAEAHERSLNSITKHTPTSRWLEYQSRTVNMSPNELVLLEEILRTRFLLIHGINTHLNRKLGLTTEVWKKIIDEADQGGEIFKKMLQSVLKAHKITGYDSKPREMTHDEWLAYEINRPIREKK